MKTKIKKLSKRNPKEKIKNITIIIVYHTFINRMKAFGPTPLIPLKRKLLIDKQIEIIDKVFDKYNIVIAAGYGAYDIYKHLSFKHNCNNIRVVENSNFNQSSPTETLSLALNNITTNNVLIVEGSLLINERAIRKIDFNKNSTIFYNTNNNDEAGLNVGRNNKIEHFSFGASKGWSEVLFLKTRRDVEILKDKIAKGSNRKKFMFEVLNNIIENGQIKINGIEHNSQIVKINSLYTYNEIERKNK